MANIASGALLGFKTGTQAKLDTMLKTGGVEGCFYLTEDTHRLYVGNADRTISPVNEGVISVDYISSGSQGYTAGSSTLPDVATGAANAGQFYYVKNGNILCVFNGQEWIQINSNTNTTIASLATTTTVTDDVASIATTVKSSDYAEKTATFKIAGDNGITIADNDINGVAGITISGDTYEIGTADGDTTDTVKVTLTSANTDNDSDITFAAGNFTGETIPNVTLSQANGVVTIAARDSVNKTVAFSNGIAANNTNGFKVTITDNHNKEVAGTVDPTITVGVAANKKETVHFSNGNAALNVYTKDELDETLTALNAMTYRGTVGATGSAGLGVITSGTGADTVISGIMGSGGTAITDIAIGDTFLLSEETTVGPIGLRPGTLLIAKGTEDATTGYITSASLAFDVVKETYIADSTYKFVENSDKTGITLLSANNGATKPAGGLVVTGGTTTGGAGMTVNATATTSIEGYVNETFTVTHNTVTRTDTTGTAVSQPKANSSTNATTTITVPIITGVTSDTTGHITGIETTNYTFQDTNGKIKSDTFAATVNADKTVGTITNSIVFQEGSQHEVTTTGTMTVESQSIQIEQNTTGNGLVMNVVWGSFE